MQGFSEGTVEKRRSIGPGKYKSPQQILKQSIETLEEAESEKIRNSCDFRSITPKQHREISRLVGEQCSVNCSIGDVNIAGLWDTGSRVSLISRQWLENNIPDSEILDLSTILDQPLEIVAVGGASIPYEGYAILDLKLNGSPEAIKVPFLITKCRLKEPIIGFNVIKTICTDSNFQGVQPCISTSFNVSELTASAVITMMQEEDDDVISCVRTLKQGARIPAKQTVILNCKMDTQHFDKDTPVIFEPSETVDGRISIDEQLLVIKQGVKSRIDIVVTNRSHRDITLGGRNPLGQLTLISSIVTADVEKVDTKQQATKAKNMRWSNHSANVSSTSANEDNDKEHKRQDKTNGEKERWFIEEFSKLKLDHLTQNQREAVEEMLYQERDVFSKDGEIGDAQELEMTINTTDEIPVQKIYNSIPRPLLEEVKMHVADLLNHGWITRSRSSYSSPCVIARKPCGGIRFCCDFRALNKKTIPDKHPLPRIQETLESLGGNTWFTVLDQSRAYYQGYVTPESRKKTAFVTPWGLYEWVRIPFGLQNAPATFQRFMESTLEEYRDRFAIPYLDDAIVYSDKFNDHVDHVGKTLSQLRKKGLKLNPRKCNFFQNQVKYLGRIVCKEGYKMDDSSIMAVQTLKDLKPQSIGDVRKLMGMLSYHRRHIQDFSKIAKPLTDLLAVPKDACASKKSGKIPVQWKTEHQGSLNKLIDLVTSQPLLAYPDYENGEEFFIHTDASAMGLGAILYQKQQGMDRAIAYASRTLLPAEKNYHSTRLEFLALKWAICEKFDKYLGYTDHFTSYTDNNPLLYILNSSKLNANGQRWASELSEFNFTIKYRAGVVNKDADCLSRLPLDIEKYSDLCKEEITVDQFNAIMAGVSVQKSNDETWVAAIKACNEKAEAEEIGSADRVQVLNMQWDDPVISLFLANTSHTTAVEKLTAHQKEVYNLLKREQNKLRVDDDGVLIRKAGKIEQVVLPESLKEDIMTELHNEMGHVGLEKVFQLARERVYWPRMHSEIEAYIQKCGCKLQKKPPRNIQAPLQEITTSAPMELVAIDFVHLEKSSGGHKYILVIVDHFTRFAQAYATRNKSSATAAKHLYGDFVLRFGVPTRILHDQGREFENSLFKDLNKLCEITRSRTTPYHPQTNGSCERMNRTLLSMLRTLPETQKTQWHKMVNKMIFAYNATRHDTTQFSPYYLMFGRRAKIPIDNIIGKKAETTTNRYANEFKEEMEEAYRIAERNVSKRKNQDKMRRNSGPVLGALVVGDRVLVKNVETGGPGKLRSYWEQRVYIIEKVNGVVYTISDEGNTRRRWRVVHRNMLMPCGDVQITQEKTTPPATGIRTRQQKLKCPEIDTNDRSDSESEDEIMLEPVTLSRLREQSMDNSQTDGVSEATATVENEETHETPAEASAEIVTDEQTVFQEVEDGNVEEHRMVETVESPERGSNDVREEKRRRQQPQRLEYFAPGKSITNAVFQQSNTNNSMAPPTNTQPAWTNYETGVAPQQYNQEMSIQQQRQQIQKQIYQLMHLLCSMDMMIDVQDA